MGIANAMEAVFGKPVAVVPAPTSGRPVSPMQPGTVVPIPGTQQTDPQTPPEPAAPLDKFSKVWQTPVVDPKAPQLPKSFLESITQESVSESAKKVAFQNAVNPELLAKIAAGGADGVQAMLEAMNSMTQDVYGKSALLTAAVVKKALEEQAATFESSLPDRVRKLGITGASKTKNSVFSNPALKPIATALEGQFASQYPEASAPEIAGMVEEYFKGIAAEFTPKPSPKAAGRNGTDDVDWNAIIDSDENQ